MEKRDHLRINPAKFGVAIDPGVSEEISFKTKCEQTHYGRLDSEWFLQSFVQVEL